MPLIFTPLPDLPLIHPGDMLIDIIQTGMEACHLKFEDGDILVIAQKIVSKVEGRLVNLTTVNPGIRALELAKITGKDPRFVELVLQESREVLRVGVNTLIVEHKNGFICANAGIDHSNVQGDWGEEEDWVLLLPEDSDHSAAVLRAELENRTGKKLGILIIDSHGRAWRVGTVGVTIGLSGIPGVVDLRGQPDLFGFRLRITQVGAADELAASASLMMGQAAEGSPIVHVRGFPYPLREGQLTEMIRDKNQDLFR